MATLKELAATANLVAQEALEQALTELKSYIDTQDTAGATAASAAVENLQTQLNTLIGTTDDVDKVINTFNEVKAFLADYSEDDTLKSLIDAAISAATTAASTAESNAKAYTDTKVGAEKTRAENAETALSGRITTLENVNIMTAAQATTLYNSVFNPSTGS